MSEQITTLDDLSKIGYVNLGTAEQRYLTHTDGNGSRVDENFDPSNLPEGTQEGRHLVHILARYIGGVQKSPLSRVPTLHIYHPEDAPYSGIRAGEHDPILFTGTKYIRQAQAELTNVNADPRATKLAHNAMTWEEVDKQRGLWVADPYQNEHRRWIAEGVQEHVDTVFAIAGLAGTLGFAGQELWGIELADLRQQ